MAVGLGARAISTSARTAGGPAQLDLGRDEGRRRQRITVSGPTRSAFVEELNELAYKQRHGVLLRRDDVTLARFAGTWPERKARELRPSAIANYRTLLKSYVMAMLGGAKLQPIHPAHVRDLLDPIADSGLGSRTQRYCA